MTRVHFDSKTCPYAQRSWIALIEKGLSFEIRPVDLANKDAAFVDLYHSINPDPASAAKVPILVEPDGSAFIESNVIVEYLDQKYLHPPLLPTSPASAARVRHFIEFFSGTFTAALFGLFRADTRAAVEEATRKLEAALKAVDAFLLLHGNEEGGSYLMGGTYTMAEACCTSFLQRALPTLPAFRGIDVDKLVERGGLRRLRRWMDAALARPSALETKPSDEAIVASLAKFVQQMKD